MKSKKSPFLCALGLIAVGVTAINMVKSNGPKELKYKKGMSVNEFVKIYPEFESGLKNWRSFPPPIWEQMIRQKIDDTDCDIFLRFDENKILYELRIAPHGIDTGSYDPRDNIAAVKKWWDGVKSKDRFQGWDNVEVIMPNHLMEVIFVCMT